MEKHPNPLDDSIREALKGHGIVPREKARKAFLDEASRVIPPGRFRKNWYLLPALILIVSGIIALIVVTGREKKVPAVSEIPDTQINQQLTGNRSETGTAIMADNPSDELTHTNDPNSTRESIREYSSPDSITSSSQAIKISNQNQSYVKDRAMQEPVALSSVTDVLPATGAENPQGTGNGIIPVEPVLQDTVNLVKNEANPGAQAGIPEPKWQDTGDSSLTPAALPAGGKTEKERLQTPGYFLASVCYQPELMFNTLEDSKFINNFGLEAIFYKGRISIRTGVGLSISKGITKNSVGYNDYLGTYNKLDSITFTFNAAEQNFEPNLFMSSQKVWDSIQQFDSTDVIKRYTYLQVPLVLGFDFWQRGKLSAGVRIGTIMSVMLHSRQLTGEYDPGQNQVVGVTQFTPGQVNVNWQALGGLSATAMLTKNIYLDIEPQARYYYQSIYEKSSLTQKPWSISIRMAIGMKF